MKFIRFIQFVFLLAFCQHIEAQTITGYVFDAKDGEPIIGASVLNGKNGCMTDFDGKFVISGKPGDKLTFKAFGCSDKKVAAQNNMEVGMGKGSYTKMKRAAAATSSTSRNSSSSSSSSSSSKSSTSSEPCYVKSKKQKKMDLNGHGIMIFPSRQNGLEPWMPTAIYLSLLPSISLLYATGVSKTTKDFSMSKQRMTKKVYMI